MSDDRVLPPSPARVAAAARGGLRPGVGPRVRAAAFVGTVVFVAQFLRGFDLTAWLHAGAEHALDGVLATVGTAVVWGGVAGLAGTLLAGVRPVDRRQRDRFAHVAVRRPAAATVGGHVVTGALALVAGLAFVAAAARAVDADAGGWATFAAGWGRAAAWGLGVGLWVLAAYAWLVERRAIFRSLYQSPAERRAERRAS